jgi:uncharacterized protein YdeI (YjbR/CyaY-like superfamily)
MLEVCLMTRAEWRRWLARNHDTETGVWLVFHKNSASGQSLEYETVVEEALCYGWIDSIIKKLDDDRYARKLTPRRTSSKWSESNKRRVAKLIKSGRMTKHGLSKIEAAKRTGKWSESAALKIPRNMPDELRKALARNKKANAFFEQLGPSYRRQFIGWIAAATRAETKRLRVEESVARLARGEKLGMK